VHRSDTTPIKRQWAFSFVWINLAVAVVVLVQIATHQISSLRELMQMLAYALIYANLTGVLGVLAISGAVERLALRKVPVAPVVAVGVIVSCAAGCLLAQTLLMEIGFVVPPNFWQEYFRTLRVAMPLAMVFGLGAVVHGSLRERVQLVEASLREKEAAEQRAQKLAVEARLRSLEARIQPHFLFNTLNSISSLITVDPVRAEQKTGAASPRSAGLHTAAAGVFSSPWRGSM